MSVSNFGVVIVIYKTDYINIKLLKYASHMFWCSGDIYGKRDNFDFPIVNVPPDGSVPMLNRIGNGRLTCLKLLEMFVQCCRLVVLPWLI